MDTELSLTPKVQLMKANGWTTCNMDMVAKRGAKAKLSSKETISRAKRMAKVATSGKMAATMRATSSTACSAEKVSMASLVARCSVLMFRLCRCVLLCGEREDIRRSVPTECLRRIRQIVIQGWSPLRWAI